ncbi:MAG: delta 1-pyrroline-5-carboxylate reductase [Phylliscum demangeonii]|nr:MAG: delta 1-pyrroline-5-carboxylate reductase [Phylliscum demangeonii]
MGIAILSGILSSLAELKTSSSSFLALHNPGPSVSGTSTPAEELPTHLPTRFIACVRRHESAKRVRAALSAYASSLKIVQNDNRGGVEAGDVIILCCKPQMVSTVLGDVLSPAPSSSSAPTDVLRGKLLISICAGVSVPQIEELIYGSVSDADPDHEGRCRIVRAMPNTAAFIRESMTVIATPRTPLPPPTSALITWIFSRIGRVVYLPPSAMDASTALCGSGPAFYALVLEAMADGAVAMGLPRAEAQLMAAQTMRGTAGLVLAGEHPAMVREKVGTPGGCTIGGCLVLEEGRVRGTVARAVREATVVASQLGKGVEGVNGTRF